MTPIEKLRKEHKLKADKSGLSNNDMYSYLTECAQTGDRFQREYTYTEWVVKRQKEREEVGNDKD